MMIHLGCGRKRWPGWLNVDARPGPDVDLACDIMQFYPAAGAADAVAAVHVLEHLTEAECRELCRRVAGWLRDGGEFIVEMPDRAKCLTLATSPMAPTPGPYRWEDPPIQGLGGLLGDRPGLHDAWVGWLAGNASTVVSGVQRGDYESFLPAEFSVPLENHRHVWTDAEFSRLLADCGFRNISAETPQHHGKRAHRDMRVVAKAKA